MRQCPDTRTECLFPHLRCGTCPVHGEAVTVRPDALSERSYRLALPDPAPFISFSTPTGEPGVVVGIKGTF